MKKKFLKFSIVALLSITASAQVVNLDNGWNNVGIINDTQLSDFNNTHIKYVWQYTHGQWKVYSPDSELMQKIRENIQNGYATYGVIPSMLNQGSAVWIYTDENLQIRIGEANVYTSISGVVKDAITHDLVSNFTVIVDNSTTYNETNGTLLLNNISLGQHLISIHADGYKDTNISVDLENSTPYNIGQIELVPQTAVHEVNVSGTIFDATTGNPIDENISMQIRPGYNSTETPIVDTVLNNGYYNIQIPAGSYTIILNADGYYPATYNYTFTSDSNNSQIIKDFALNPEQNASAEVPLRVILTWGETPTDLDSHLVAIDDSNHSVLWQVDYENMSVYDNNGSMICQLDVDDTTSYGPETVTLYDLNNSLTYKYFVYNFSGEEDIKNSNADVKVYYNGREYDFHAPNEDGTFWKVFEIDHGTLVPCIENCMYNGGTDQYDNNETFLLNMRINNSDDAKAISAIIDDYINNPK